MGRKPKAPAADRPLLLRLPNDLALDLWAFSQAHFGAPHTAIIAKAVRQLIDNELAADSVARKRFEEARQTALSAGTLQLVRPASAGGS